MHETEGQARVLDDSALVSAEQSLVLDMLTTMQFKTYWWRMSEINPILGEHPSDVKVLGYFALTMVGTGVLWQTLPAKARPLLYVLAAVEGYWFLHNSVALNANHALARQGWTPERRSPYRKVEVNALSPERTFTLAFAF